MNQPTPPFFDVAIIGAGAAGLFCAGRAAQRGLKVLLIDHAPKIAEKVRISGGGRANFTNRDLDVRQPHRHFVGLNPQFCRSALSRYTPADFVALVEKHGIAYHEKHKGQLFADHSAEDLIAMLLAECERGQVTRWQPCGVKKISQPPPSADFSKATRYQIDTDHGTALAGSMVVATGGLSIPKIGATDLGYRIAEQFGLQVTPRTPGLVPLTFDAAAWQPYAELAGLALPVVVSTGGKKQRIEFHEDLLFTHRGLSGPAILQISSYWQPGTPIAINLAPELDLADWLLRAKQHSRKTIANELAGVLPTRLAQAWVQQDEQWQRPIAEASDKALLRLAERLAHWEITPTGTEGYKKAEVTIGGVATSELSQQTLESRQHPGLFFIGEVVDITGWLGGYNFQWAWASAAACADALAEHASVPTFEKPL